MTVEIYHGDCMEAMPKMKDKEFDLAIVDPPYGLGDCVSSKSQNRHKSMEWNKTTPGLEYFKELERVSKNRIIWGVNYYIGIPFPPGRIIHDKINGDCQSATLSDADIASQSFNNLIKIWPYRWRGNVQGNLINWKNSGIDSRIHPTQKPIRLYEYLLKNYAKPGDKILDTHLGSGSSAIACDIMGYDFVGYEIDEDYYKAALDRFNRHKQQTVMEFN